MNQSIFDHPLIAERSFFPRKVAFESPFWVDCEEAKLACYYFQKYPGEKTIVFFHGNGEVVTDYIDLYIPVFDRLGYNCFLAEYRGYGMSTGRVALGAMLEDVEKVIKAIDQPLEKTVLFGRSIGSLFALHGVSLFTGIAGLIIESGIANILERLLLRVHPAEIGITLDALKTEAEKRFNHREKLAGYKGSTLILHARHDSLIHYSHGQQLYEWASEPKQIKIFDRGDHNDIMVVNVQEYFQRIDRFLARL
jgi:pimeloyl-ACP methyl ester carboxylesterase